MKNNLWIGLIALGALLGILALGQDLLPSAPRNLEPAQEPLRRVTVDLAKLAGIQTAVGYRHTNQPPWPNGNCLTLEPKTNATSELPPEQWRLVNMHAENFHELVKRQRLKSLDMGFLSDHRCLVVDSRVPREWFLTRPCSACWPLERRLLMKTQFAQYFRKNLQEEALIGTAWVLVSRQDPDGLIARVLPGERIDFGAVELICRTGSGEIHGRRFWECHGSSVPFSLSVYEVQSTNAYRGATLKVTQQKDQMVLIPQDILKRDASSVYSEGYMVGAEVVYRRQGRSRAR